MSSKLMRSDDWKRVLDGLELASWENGYRNALVDVLTQIRLGNKDLRGFCHEMNEQVPFLRVEVFQKTHRRAPKV